MRSISVDNTRHIVFSVYKGTVTDTEVCEQIRELNALGLSAGYSEIIDLRSVTELQVTTSKWCEMARLPLFTTHRIAVATADAVFGMARMFEICAETKSSIQVVRSMEEALEILIHAA